MRFGSSSKITCLRFTRSGLVGHFLVWDCPYSCSIPDDHIAPRRSALQASPEPALATSVANGRTLRHVSANSFEAAQAGSRVQDYSHRRRHRPVALRKVLFPVSLDDLRAVVRESHAPGWTVACAVMAREIRATEQVKAPRHKQQRLPCRKGRVNHAAATASWRLTAQTGECSFGCSMPKQRPTHGRVPRDREWACPIRMDNGQAIHGSALPPAQTCRDRGT